VGADGSGQSTAYLNERPLMGTTPSKRARPMRDTLLAAASRCAIGRICLKPTLAVTDLNDRHWSVRAIKPISVGPDQCIAESVIMQPFAQTGPVGIPRACERRC